MVDQPDNPDSGTGPGDTQGSLFGQDSPTHNRQDRPEKADEVSEVSENKEAAPVDDPAPGVDDPQSAAPDATPEPQGKPDDDYDAMEEQWEEVPWEPEPLEPTAETGGGGDGPPDSTDMDFQGYDHDDEPGRESLTEMSLWEHIDELRKRIIYSAIGLLPAMVIGLVFGMSIVRFLRRPYDQAVRATGGNSDLIATSVGSGFNMYLRVSFYTALVLASWWIIYQMWMFVAAGLYSHERRYVKLAVPFSVGLFLGGAVFFQTVVASQALQFFLGFDQSLGARTMYTVQEYIKFVTNMMIITGAVFQMPLVVLVLAKVGLMDMHKLRTYRRHTIAIIVVLSAVATPPDPYTLIALAVPMWALYELGVVLAWWLVFRKEKA